MKCKNPDLYECARPVVVWGALALTGYTRISLPQIHFRAKSSESILVVLECLNGHLVASCGSNYRFRRLGAPMPCGAGSSLLHQKTIAASQEMSQGGTLLCSHNGKKGAGSLAPLGVLGSL